MRKSIVLEKIKKREPVLAVITELCDPCVIELASLMGFDALWLDLEHHALSVEKAQDLMRAARIGKSDIMARPGKGEFMRMSRLLEAGAQGIMYPRVESVKEAKDVVKWAKFYPEGERGVDGANPDVPYGSLPYSKYIKTANQETFLVVQIEDKKALKIAPEIADISGVDVIFLGPLDFSVLNGYPGDTTHKDILEAFKIMNKAANDAGKIWGTLAGSLDYVKLAREYGASFICYGEDFMFVKEGFEKVQADCLKLGFSFKNSLIQ